MIYIYYKLDVDDDAFEMFDVVWSVECELALPDLNLSP